nr:protein SPT2 homolog [Camelus dromedarius]
MGSVRSDHVGQRSSVSPGCGDLPRSFSLASSPPLPPRGPAPPRPPRAQRGGYAPALPAACRAGGRRGRGPEGGTRGPRCTAAPGVGEARGPARCGEGAEGDPGWPATCDATGGFYVWGRPGPTPHLRPLKRAERESAAAGRRFKETGKRETAGAFWHAFMIKTRKNLPLPLCSTAKIWFQTCHCSLSNTSLLSACPPGDLHLVDFNHVEA